MGSLGTSVSGITDLVSSTANLANSYLSKPLISNAKKILILQRIMIQRIMIQIQMLFQ